MRILQITLSLIWSLSLQKNISVIMGKSEQPKTLSGLNNFNKKLLQQHQNGISQKRVGNGIGNMHLQQPLLYLKKQLKKNVCFAVRPIRQAFQNKANLNSALITAKADIDKKREVIQYKKSVSFAAIASSLINIGRQIHAQKSVLVRIEEKNRRIENVYDIMVDNQHEYFANGLLVHNCKDAVRYGVVTHKTKLTQTQVVVGHTDKPEDGSHYTMTPEELLENL